MIELLLAAERMLADGLPDQAERLFAQVAEADPQNAIAVVGLARVALTRGDQEGAGILARRALEIDPENAAAQHLMESLATVAGPDALVEPAFAPPPSVEVMAGAEPAAPEPATTPEVVIPRELEPTPEPVWRGSWLARLVGFFRR